jgi:hypothetical protein
VGGGALVVLAIVIGVVAATLLAGGALLRKPTGAGTGTVYDTYRERWEGTTRVGRRDPALASVRTRMMSNQTGQHQDWATLQVLLAPRNETPSPEG